jgi:hypothetical protein
MILSGIKPLTLDLSQGPASSRDDIQLVAAPRAAASYTSAIPSKLCKRKASVEAA